jgi:uncharacterized protein DUF4234
MAEVVVVEGESFKKRSPWGVWLLGFITIGIYGLVWYYKINDEARRYLRDDSIRPGVAVLALVPGFLLILPPFISIFHTAQRIQRMEDKAGVQRAIEPIIGLVLAFIWSLYVPYYQYHLNGVWDRAVSAGVSFPPVRQPPAVPPPPPPAG